MNQTKTEEIFSNSCPYSNHSQGSELRVLFVCTAGLLRSPTAARIAGEYGINARAAGSNLALALIPVNVNLLKWADHVVCMTSSDSLRIERSIPDYDTLFEFRKKCIDWNIEDHYNYMDESLVWVLRKRIETTFERKL